MAESAFFFVVPQCEKEAKLQMQAPDGKTLVVPLPAEADPGDELHMAKGEDGRWGMTHLVKTGSDASPAQAAQFPEPEKKGRPPTGCFSYLARLLR